MNNLLSNIPVHDGRLFLVQRQGKEYTLTADASMVEHHSFRIAERLYNDACDVGFYIKSQRTGNKVLFAVDEFNEQFVKGCSIDNPNIKVVIFNT